MAEASMPITSVPELRFSGIEGAARVLAGKVRESGFSPDVIVYVERGARFVARSLAEFLGCGAIAVRASRRGNLIKSILAPLVRVLPRRWRDALRRLEERRLWSAGDEAPRVVESEFDGSLGGNRVLVVDDAADSGRTIRGCLAWLEARGVRRDNVRVAVLAATTEAGRGVSDFWLFDRNTRFPWSSDSPDFAAARRAYADSEPKRHATRDL